MYSCILDDKPARGKMICKSANKFALRICIDSLYCKTKGTTQHPLLNMSGTPKNANEMSL